MVGSNGTMIAIRLVRSKLRKREDHSNAVHPEAAVVQTATSPVSTIVAPSYPAEGCCTQTSVTPHRRIWEIAQLLNRITSMLRPIRQINSFGSFRLLIHRLTHRRSIRCTTTRLVYTLFYFLISSPFPSFFSFFISFPFFSLSFPFFFFSQSRRKRGLRVSSFWLRIPLYISATLTSRASITRFDWFIRNLPGLLDHCSNYR